MPGGAGTGRGSEGRPAAYLRAEGDAQKQELRKIRQEIFAAKDGMESAEHVEKAKETRLELLALKNELRAAREGNPELRTVPPSEDEEAQTTEAPPDFAITGRTYRW